jgi:hypothetical protein
MDLLPKSDMTGVQTINLRDLGFVGRVSAGALAEIDAMERKQHRLFAEDRTVFD